MPEERIGVIDTAVTKASIGIASKATTRETATHSTGAGRFPLAILRFPNVGGIIGSIGWMFRNTARLPQIGDEP